jgi:hypothetical protein
MTPMQKVCCLSAIAVVTSLRLLAGAAEPAGVKFVAEIKQDPAANLKLDWTSVTYVKGEFLFVISHRDGRINTFKRDVKTGSVNYMGFHDLAGQLGKAGRHLDAYPVLTDRNILYVTGEWTHSHGNSDGLGLSWYQFIPPTDR